MFTSADVLEMQQDQYQHDKRNHLDILGLHKNDRLKHYGLHFCKYVGRLARGRDESKAVERTIIDTILVSLSSANALHQRLEAVEDSPANSEMRNDIVLKYADASGRFADACEKIDHHEEFLSIAKQANTDIFDLTIKYAQALHIDVRSELSHRRKELAARQFFIRD